jgi:hypothetical protein
MLSMRWTATAMAAVLAAYGSALLVERLAGLRVDAVILAVALTMTTARIQRAAAPPDRLAGLVVLPAAALAAAGISTVMSAHPDAGDALFVAGMALSIWVRRFGQHATRAGTLLVAPLVALLIMPPPGTFWVALIAFISWFWVTVFQLLVPAPAAPGPAAASPARRRIRASTRMALQMAAALAAAFVVGRTLWPDHWTWTVLTAFIVCSGARSRGDVVLKGLLRGAGAAAGTVVATAIAGAFGPRADGAVVVIFVVLAIATWLREFSYVWWAACVTAVLSLLYGWFGQAAGGLLDTRLEGIAVGAAVGIAASWLILPVRTSDVARRRSADALAALGDVLSADWRDPAALRRDQAAFARAVAALAQIAPALRMRRRLLSRLRPGRPELADAIDAITRSARPVRVLVSAATGDLTVAADPCVARLSGAVAANVAAARRAVGRRPGAVYRPAAAAECPEDAAVILGALADIDGALAAVCAAFTA